MYQPAPETTMTNLHYQMPQHNQDNNFASNYEYIASTCFQQQQHQFNAYYAAQNYAYMQPQQTTYMPQQQHDYMKAPVMDTSKPATKTKRSRTVYTNHQLAELEREFASNPFLYSTRRSDIAKSLNLCERQVKVWFQNRRIKQKRIDSGQQLPGIKGRFGGNQRQRPTEAIVQRLMSYSQEAQHVAATQIAATKITMPEIIHLPQLQQQKTPTIAEYNIKIEVLDPDLYQQATANATEHHFDLNLVKKEPMPVPAIDDEIIECIDLTDVMDCVAAEANAVSDEKIATATTNAELSPPSTSSTVSVSDWFTREDIISGIQRELELSAEQYAAVAANDYVRPWQMHEMAATNSTITETTLINVVDLSADEVCNVDESVEFSSISPTSSETCSTENDWSQENSQASNFEIHANLTANFDEKPKVTEVINLSPAVFSY